MSFLWLSFHYLIPSSLLRWHLCSGAFPVIPFKIATSLPLHSPASRSSFSVSLCDSSGQLLLSLLWSISHPSPRHQPNAWHTVGTQQSATCMSGKLFLLSRCLGFCGAQCWAQSGHPCVISTVVSLSLSSICHPSHPLWPLPGPHSCSQPPPLSLLAAAARTFLTSPPQAITPHSETSSGSLPAPRPGTRGLHWRPLQGLLPRTPVTAVASRQTCQDFT